LQFKIQNLAKASWKANAEKTLKSWIQLDQENIDGRKTGFTLYRHPLKYLTNKPLSDVRSFAGNFKDAESNPTTRRMYFDLLFKQLAQLANTSAAAGNKEQFVAVRALALSVMSDASLPDCWGAHIFAFCHNSGAKHLGLDGELKVEKVKRHGKRDL
jgi:hypothetical protein